MPSSYPGRHIPLPRLEPGTSGKRWVSVANWATQLVYTCVYRHFLNYKYVYIMKNIYIRNLKSVGTQIKRMLIELSCIGTESLNNNQKSLNLNSKVKP
ncbi:hypothetical protein Hanom_Chr17g01550141 [Helianthus anomalus]